MNLFAEQGYTATTVAQIADAADVSHTTFFRYFQSKEQVVLSDDLAEARTAVLTSAPPGLDRFDLVRHLVTGLFEIAEGDEWASSPARLRLIQSEPTLYATHQLESDRLLVETSGFVARYLGADEDDVRLRVFIAAVAGVLFHVVNQAGEGEIPTLDECLEAIALLEAGLPV